MLISVCRAIRVVFCAVLVSGFGSFLQAQSSGLTYYKVANASSVDTSGNVLSGTANSNVAFQTDGTTVVFLNRTGTNDGNEACSSSWGLYTTPIKGGTITPLVTSSTKVEASEPAGTVVSICEQPILVGGKVFYGADYTSAGGTRRYGIFSIPLAGGTSVDVVATGDTIAGAGVVTAVGSEEVQNIQSTAVPGVNQYLAAFTTASGIYTMVVPSSGAAAATVQAAIQCDGYTLGAPQVSNIYSDGNGLYASLSNISYPPNTTKNGYFVQSHVVIITGSSPTNFSCTVAYDPYVPGTDSGSGGINYYTLPGEPSVPAGGTGSLAGVNVFSQLAVSGTTLYFHASRLYAGNSAGYGITYDGLFALSGGTASVVWSNITAIPGIDPTIPYCSPTLVVPPTVGSVLSAGKYVVFSALQDLINCTTLTSATWAGGIYVYDPTAKTITRVVADQTVLVPGEIAYRKLTSWGLTPGDLAADGHLIFGNIDSWDTNFNATSSTLYSTYLGQTVTAVSLTGPSSAAFGASVSLVAKVAPNTGQTANATGSVSFYSGTKLLGTQAIDSTGTATLSTNSAPMGSDSITAVYAGDALYEGATSAVAPLTVAQAGSSVALVSSPAGTVFASGTSLTFTATVAAQVGGTPTGSVLFKDGSATLATVTLGSMNSASYTTAALVAGSHSITATYGGDGNFVGSGSSALAFTIGTADYTITATPASATITAGQSATFTFTVTPLLGFNQTVALACSGLPANATCTFSPASLTPTGGAVTSTLTIATDVKTAALERMRFGAGAVFACAVFLMPFARRRRFTRLAGVLVLVAIGSLAGCSSGSAGSTTSTSGGTVTPVGSYTVGVTANAGAGVTHSASISVVIQ